MLYLSTKEDNNYICFVMNEDLIISHVPPEHSRMVWHLLRSNKAASLEGLV